MANRFLHIIAILIFAFLPADLAALTKAAADSVAVADTVTTRNHHHGASRSSVKNHKTVAVISSFTQDSPWSNDYIPFVTMAASSVPNTYCEIYYLNSVLITDTVKFNTVKANMFENFKDKTPDYVVMIGKMAFNMRDEMKKHWGENVPMLLISHSPNIAELHYYMSGVIRRSESDAIHTEKLSSLQDRYNFTAIVVPPHYEETIELMVETMHHEINEIVFVAVPTYLERTNSLRISRYLADHYPGIKFRWLYADAKNVDEMRSLLVERRPGTGILLSNWATQIPGPLGYPIISNQETKLLSSSANPVFVTSASLIDNGAAGGVFCDGNVVNNRISYYMNSMFDGKPMSELPVYICKKKAEVINYQRALQYGLSISGLANSVELRGRTRTFWQKYHWETIIAGIVLLLLIFLFWKRSQLQAREIKALQMHRKFVASMPVAYGHATLHFNADGTRVNNVVYSNLNDAMQDLIKTNGCKTGEYVLFPINLVNEKAIELFEKGHKIDFVHHFEKTDTYYDVFVDLVNKDDHRVDHSVKELDIFAVDVSNRVRMEKELKQLSRKLDLTINLTGIIPWEWDVKTDVMKFDAYSLFGRQLHDVDDMQGSSTPSTYLDVVSEMMPLIHPDDIAKVEKMRQGLLTKAIKNFRISYRMEVVRNGGKEYQMIEARGSVTSYDTKGNPAVCAGGMWAVDD